ncbi:hypothetical protein [Spirulina sp. 06S082]|uniref:hypothetical protein n=1 Tax=Spirulina sp. 06S082 TaxID=3110248 RepID=UPI002B1FAD48|nr:hypothetical protein [Spirulina sp. 06S082]MEA5468724.1 hypothetical protein [Spirulina sp. 06S082]
MQPTEIHSLSHSLRQIDRKLLSHDRIAGIERVWYQGGEPYFDLFIDLREDEIEWFQLTLRGRSISWHRQENCWKTGNTNEFRNDDITFYAASKIVESDRTPDREFFDLARAIVQNRAGEALFDRLSDLFYTTQAPVS